jgi:hypothetical protein
MSTFAERLRNATSPGYDNSLRRSIQSVVLFEARRILSQIETQRTAENLENLKAFQKKHVHWELANALLETTDLLPHQRAAVMWRTGTSREPLGPETAWKRSKTIDKELKAICDSIRPLQADGRSHDEAIDEYILQTFPAHTTRDRTREDNRMTGYTHNNCLLCYVIYYKDAELDPDLPPARAPRAIDIPTERPPAGATVAAIQPQGGEHDVNVADLEAIVSEDAKTRVEERRAVLREVRDHLDILKEFQEIIPQEELDKRKRELYLALPDAPPAARKQQRLD